MKISLLTKIRKYSFEKFLIVIFIVINIGLYYNEYLFFITSSYFFLIGYSLYKIFRHKQILYVDYILILLLLCLWSFLSIAWSYNAKQSLLYFALLCKPVLISILFINLLDTKANVKLALNALAIAGIIYSSIFFTYIDISMLGYKRLSLDSNENIDLPNINTVASILSCSCIYFIFKFIKNRNFLLLLPIGVSIIQLFLLGSRKSILFVLGGVFLFLIKGKLDSKIRILILAFTFVLLALFLVPADYLDFILERFGKLTLLYKSTGISLDYEDQLRVKMVQYGIQYFEKSPIWGFGYCNFSSLFYHDTGVPYYAHNNYIETLVGIGLIGFFLYYSIYYKMLSKIRIFKTEFDYLYLFWVLLILQLYSHFAIVVLNDRYTWILITILYSGISLFSVTGKIKKYV